MSLSTFYLGYGHHLAPLYRLRRAYAPTSITASHNNHKGISSWVSLSFLYGYGAPLGGPWGRRSSVIKSADCNDLTCRGREIWLSACLFLAQPMSILTLYLETLTVLPSGLYTQMCLQTLIKCGDLSMSTFLHQD